MVPSVKIKQRGKNRPYYHYVYNNFNRRVQNRPAKLWASKDKQADYPDDAKKPSQIPGDWTPGIEKEGKIKPESDQRHRPRRGFDKGVIHLLILHYVR